MTADRMGNKHGVEALKIKHKVFDEIEAMKKIYMELSAFDEQARFRIMQWVGSQLDRADDKKEVEDENS